MTVLGRKHYALSAGVAPSDLDETALHRRFARLERRLTATLALLVGLYVVGGVAAVVWVIPTVTPWHGVVVVVALGLVAVVVGTARRRRARA